MCFQNLIWTVQCYRPTGIKSAKKRFLTLVSLLRGRAKCGSSYSRCAPSPARFDTETSETLEDSETLLELLPILFQLVQTPYIFQFEDLHAIAYLMESPRKESRGLRLILIAEC